MSVNPNFNLFYVLKYISLILALLVSLWKLLQFLKKQIKLKKVSKDLHPFYSFEEIKKATKYYIPTNCQNIPPSNEKELIDTFSHATKERIIPFFINKIFKSNKKDDRYFIILADSGMGKTTLMINLYMRYIYKLWGKNYSIALFPLGYPDIIEEIKLIKEPNQKNTILLLDAFDEDNIAVHGYFNRLNELIDITKKFRRVIITCRTQFFPSSINEPYETGVMKHGTEKGYHFFQKFYISPFDDYDINQFLKKKFSIFNFNKRTLAKSIINDVPNLMVRPMLLSYIEDLVHHKNNYNYTNKIYKELIKKWIEREAKIKKTKETENFKNQLYRFSIDIARNIYENQKERKGLYIEGIDIKSFADTYKIDLEELEMKSKSLLNRNSLGRYKFSHKSILEYFLSQILISEALFEKKFNFEGLDQAKLFFDELFFEKNSIEFFDKLFITTKGSMSIELMNNKTSFKKWNLDKLDLKELRFSKHIKLNGFRISEFKYFETLNALETLDLSFNYITNISRLHMSQLERLNLSNNRITEIAKITSKKIQYLNISHNNIDDFTFLYELKSLRILDISDNNVNEKQIRELAKKIPECRIYTDKMNYTDDKEWYKIYIKKSTK